MREAQGDQPSRPAAGHCVCCGFQSGGSGPGRTLRERELTRMGVCGMCQGHFADTREMRERQQRDHLRRLHAELAGRTEMIRGDERRKFAKERRQIERRIRELEDELEKRPVVERNLDKEVVDEALADAAEAYRKRDVAISALSELRVMHHERANQPDQCTCGLRYAKCAVAKIADIDYVRRWEEKQAARIDKGFDHMLPPNHPRMIDRRGRYNDLRLGTVDEAFGVWGASDDADRARNAG
jgi:hypothetical protein